MIFYLKTPLTWENTFLIQYLSEKFSNNLLYHFQKVDVKAIEEERAEDSLKVYNTVDGSSAFQVAVFTRNRETFKAAAHLCLCDNCLSKYGSCKMFKTYSFIASNWKPTSYSPSIKLS